MQLPLFNCAFFAPVNKLSHLTLLLKFKQISKTE